MNQTLELAMCILAARLTFASLHCHSNSWSSCARLRDRPQPEPPSRCCSRWVALRVLPCCKIVVSVDVAAVGRYDEHCRTQPWAPRTCLWTVTPEVTAALPHVTPCDPHVTSQAAHTPAGVEALISGGMLSLCSQVWITSVVTRKSPLPFIGL